MSEEPGRTCSSPENDAPTVEGGYVTLTWTEGKLQVTSNLPRWAWVGLLRESARTL